MRDAGSAYQFELSGGNLALDFANTLGDRPRGAQEHLPAWPDLVAWGEQAGLLTQVEARALRRTAAARPREAARAHAGAVALRETVYRVFAALAAGRRVPADDLAALNRALARALAHLRVERRDGGFSWTWTPADPSFDRLLWPVTRAAGDLLVSPEREDLRECASDTCSWLFLDRSPTRRRRWCSMQVCGNRDKVRRFHLRRRSLS